MFGSPGDRIIRTTCPARARILCRRMMNLFGYRTLLCAYSVYRAREYDGVPLPIDAPFAERDVLALQEGGKHE
jgi:hypothetical protein